MAVNKLGPDDFGAAVYVNGSRLADHFSFGDTVALADLSIKWGRPKLLEKPRPAQLSLSIIDPFGTWETEVGLNGALVDVLQTQKPGTPDEFLYRRSFLGRVSSYTATRIKLTDPATGNQVAVWRIDLVALDGLADLAQAQTLGPGAGGTWPSVTQGARINQIAAAAPGLINAIVTSGDNTPSGGNYTVRDYGPADGASLLGLLERCFAHIPGGWVNATPGGTIDIGQPVAAKGLALVLLAGKIITRFLGDYELDAGLIETGGPVTATSNVQDAIDAIKIGHYDAAGNPATLEGTTARYDPATRGLRVWQIQTDIQNSPAVAAQVLAGAIALANQLNGTMQPQTLTLDLVGRGSRLPTDSNFYTVMMEPATRPKTIHFGRSVLNALPSIAVSNQVIGGNLTFREPGRLGWCHHFDLAPTLNPPPGITVGALVTNLTPTIGDFDPSITIGTLGLITNGLA